MPWLQIAQRREVLRLATMDPFKEPARPMSHWDFVLKEMQWMAVDFTEVTACYVQAYSLLNRSGLLTYAPSL